MMREARAMDDQVIAKLRKDFSSISTMNQVREKLRNLVQPPDQPFSVYIYFVFSCLLDSVAEISCMKMDTIATLGLMGQMSKSSVSVNNASRKNMGFAGDVYVSFKIDRKYSFTEMFMSCEHLSRPFI